MVASESERRIESIWTALATGALVGVGVLVNLFANWQGLTTASAGSPGLAPEFRSHLLGVNLWLGAAIGLNVLRLLGKEGRLPRWGRLALDLLGAATLGRMILGGPICVTPVATTVAKVLMTAVLLVLLLGLSDSLAQALRGQDLWTAYGEPDLQAG